MLCLALSFIIKISLILCVYKLTLDFVLIKAIILMIIFWILEV